MAYDTANPPVLITKPIGGTGISIWQYQSTDASTVVDGAGYFTNAGALGMKARDVVLVYNSSAGSLTSHTVVSVSATYPGAGNLSDGVTLSNANSD